MTLLLDRIHAAFEARGQACEVAGVGRRAIFRVASGSEGRIYNSDAVIAGHERPLWWIFLPGEVSLVLGSQVVWEGASHEALFVRRHRLGSTTLVTSALLGVPVPPSP